jgi:hypothetical protein
MPEDTPTCAPLYQFIRGRANPYFVLGVKSQSTKLEFVRSSFKVGPSARGERTALRFFY